VDTASLGALAALANSLTWALASTTYARAARLRGAAPVALSRSLLALPAYLAWAALSTGIGGFAALGARGLGWLALSTIGSYTVGDALFFAAARRLGASRALAIASVYPLWTTLLGVAFVGERLGALRGVGVALCVLGVIALVAPRGSGGERSQSGARGAGLAMALGASALWALNGLAIREGALGASLPAVNATRHLFAVIALGAVVAIDRARRPPEGRGPLLPVDVWPMLLPMVLLDGVVGSSLFVYSFTHADLAVAATLNSLAPLFAVPIALATGDERWSAARLAAVASTVGGVALLVGGVR